MATYPEQLNKLIQFFRKLPGVGKKTAERFAFTILSWSNDEIKNFSTTLFELKEKILTCQECGAIFSTDPCPFCHREKRECSELCIVSSPKDLFAIENTHLYKGLYHVLDGLLSPIDGIGLEEISFLRLLKRIETLECSEVILALDATIEGDATALYLKEELEKRKILVTRLAHGMPLGSSLDFVDEGTLSKALSSRSSF